MIRDVDVEFDKWVEDGCSRPLAVTGVRGCGKTYSARSCLEKSARKVAVFDYEMDGLGNSLENDPDGRQTASIMRRLHADLVDGDVVIIDGFHTAEQAKRASSTLIQLCRWFKVVAIGIVHGSFGDGFDEIRMNPLSFPEYLDAIGERGLSRNIRSGELEFHDRLVKLFTEFTAIGGLPAAVDAWFRSGNETDVDRAIREVLANIREDAVRYFGASSEKVGGILDSIPLNLARRNKKFMFTRAVAGARSKQMVSQLRILESINAVRKVRITEERRDLEDKLFFKLFCFDTGALRVLSGLSVSMAVSPMGNVELSNGMAENAVLCELVKAGWEDIGCWRSGNRAEAELTVRDGDSVMPIQIDIGTSMYARSLKVYEHSHEGSELIYMSPSSIGNIGNIRCIPIYAGCAFRRLI